MAESEKEIKQREIFRRNLMRYVSESGKMQIEIAEAIGVSQQTFNAWCRGVAMPRIGKVEMLADFFKCEKSDLLDDPHAIPNTSDTMSAETRLCVSLFNQLSDTDKLNALVYMQSLIQKGGDLK